MKAVACSPLSAAETSPANTSDQQCNPPNPAIRRSNRESRRAPYHDLNRPRRSSHTQSRVRSTQPAFGIVVHANRWQGRLLVEQS